MPRQPHTLRLSALVAALVALFPLLVAAPPEPEPEGDLQFRQQVLEAELGVGYAVTVDDVNGDSKPDVIAINENQAMWFENPDWTKHVISEGAAIPDHVAVAAHDIDGDGRLDLALAADWQARNTESSGTLQWLRQGEDPAGEWRLYPITSEPTLHRLRWADTDGDSKKELIAAPLHGRGTSGPEWWKGAGARLLVLRPPANPEQENWPAEVADDTLHVLHNFWVVNFDDDPADELITASHEGVHVLDRSSDGKWSRRRIGRGYDGGDSEKGAGEIKMCHLQGGRRYIATVEPWHANHAVVYEEGEDPSAEWSRRVLTDQLGGGHALWCSDLDGDGDEELAVGWRQEGEGDFAAPGVAVFDPGDWSYEIVDSGGMAAEDLVAADLDGDGRPELVASGRATHNLKIYWNESGAR